MTDADARAEEIKLLARDHAELAIATLAEVCADHEEKGAARALAAKTLLDRGFGAPERRVQKQLDVTLYDARQAHLTALQTLAARNKPLEIEDASFSEVVKQEVDNER